ncbi:MAG: DUF1800 family protein [Litorimonas sp.]
MNFRVRSALLNAVAMLALVGCGGGGGSSSSVSSPPTTGTPTPPPVSKPYTNFETREEAARFLIQAGFGGTEADIDALVGTDAADWIADQMRKPATRTLPLMQARYATRDDTAFNHSRMIWQTMLTADDELRQRMMFALSQIFVISTDPFFDQGYSTAYYTDILVDQSFGNYRTLLEDVTYSSAMAKYLTYYRNRRADERTGRMPDENYAREILQLFSIGLVELEMDGTPKAGSPETYDNEDILGLARVFTGLSGEGPSFSWNDQSEDYRHKPLQMFDDVHSPLEKSFLGTTIPENTGGTETITRALDTIADHPNVAPFISRQLIQRFTSSSPSPEYVRRVAEVFESGRYRAPNGQDFGIGRRGDFGAVIAAILLDESVHDDIQAPNEGKLREPVIKFIQYAKSFRVSDIDVWDEWRFNNTNDPNGGLAQHPLLSPSVFNFYRPGYVAPGTDSGEAGLSAPELQIVNEGASLGFVNFVSHYIMRRADDPDNYPGFRPDLTAEINLADDVPALVEHLDVKLTAGQLSEAAKADIIDVVSTLIVDGDDADVERRKRAQTAILMIMASGAYAAQN